MIQELNDTETQGVISRLQQPTSWGAGIVVANKKNGGVRKPLSCCVLREIPSKNGLASGFYDHHGDFPVL